MLPFGPLDLNNLTLKRFILIDQINELDPYIFSLSLLLLIFLQSLPVIFLYSYQLNLEVFSVVPGLNELVLELLYSPSGPLLLDILVLKLLLDVKKVSVNLLV